MASEVQKTFSAENEASLRDALKRCSPETLEAAIAYRKGGDSTQISPVILGIIERFLEPDVRPRLREANAQELRVAEDLGIDSLTLVEVVMLVEEALDMQIDNDELQNLRTIGDVKTFVEHKVKGLPSPTKPVQIDLATISETLPHGHPFLFIESATVRGQEIQGSYTISGKEAFLEGHFKTRPVFPASIMLEALGQLAVLYLLKGNDSELSRAVNPEKILFTSCDGVRCSRVCVPGDKLSMTVKPKRLRHPAATFEGAITVNGEKAVFAEEITLMFDFADAPSDAAAPAAADAQSEG